MTPFWSSGKPTTKAAIAGSARGLSYPANLLDRPGPVLIVEGASDVLALAHCGLAVVGRPAALVGSELLATLLKEVPADRPTLVVMEGLMPYLHPDDGKRLVRRIAERFPSGQIVFDIPGRWFRRLQRFNRPISTTGAVFYNSMDDPKDMTVVHPSLRVRSVVRIGETPGMELMPWYLRAWLWVLSCIPGLRTAASYYRFDF